MHSGWPSLFSFRFGGLGLGDFDLFFCSTCVLIKFSKVPRFPIVPHFYPYDLAKVDLS